MPVVELSEKKVRLAWAVDGVATTPLVVYVHIPFCSGKRSLCHFFSVPPTRGQIEWHNHYLVREIAIWAGRSDPAGFHRCAFHIGGGSPSMYAPEDFEYLLRGLGRYIGRFPDAESTVELNPEIACDAERFDKTTCVLSRLGANRLSFGAQSFNDSVLEAAGSRYRRRDTVECVERARQRGFSNINIDLIAGLLGETDESFLDSIVMVAGLFPEHITVHSLRLVEGTKLFADAKKSPHRVPGVRAIQMWK